MKRHSISRLLPLLAVAVFLVGAALAAESQPPTVNGAPIAQTQSFETCKNVAYTGRLTAADPEGDTVTFQLAQKPARGSLELTDPATGEFVYTPFENKTGKDSFTFVALDDQGNISQPAKVSLRIRKPNTKVTYADMAGQASYNAAIRLAEEGVLVGERVGDAYYFHPDEPVSRSQFIAMAMSALDCRPLSDAISTGFADDESIPTWCKGYVSAALQQGAVRGYPAEDGRVVFAPEGRVTRAEAAVILDRMLAVTDVAVTTFYPDTVSAPAWAFQAAANLESAGVLDTGASGTLSLDDTLTRGQCAQLLAGSMDVVKARETTGWFNW